VDKPSFLALMLTAAGWVYITALVIWRILRPTVGDVWLPVRLANYFTPWLLATVVVCLFMAVLVRRTWLVVVSLVLVGGISSSYWPIVIPNMAPALAAPEQPGKIKVMTFNVHFANRDADALAALIESEKPGLIAFQEITRPIIDPLRDRVGAQYPYFLVDDATNPRLAIASRYPLTGFALPEGIWRAQWALVETPSGPLVVWNVHSPPSVDQGDWEWQRRTFQAIADNLAPEECPTIVMGDLNTTDQNTNYLLLADPLIDVQRRIGRGLGFTFPDTRFYFPSHPSFGPVIRIDHILVSSQLLPTGMYIGTDRYGSDHYPVFATLAY
jgi:endonuclease/exonuclease/phosphatase family metal-dependent hydrolase